MKDMHVGGLLARCWRAMTLSSISNQNCQELKCEALQLLAACQTTLPHVYPTIIVGYVMQAHPASLSPMDVDKVSHSQQTRQTRSERHGPDHCPCPHT